MESDDCSPADLLRRIFEVLVKEVERNPALANKIIASLPASVVKIKAAGKRRPNRFNPLDYHPVTILRSHGENMLRGKLEHLNNREKLRAVAKAANLVLDPCALRPKATVAVIVEAIVQAANGYDRQRKAAVD